MFYGPVHREIARLVAEKMIIDFEDRLEKEGAKEMSDDVLTVSRAKVEAQIRESMSFVTRMANAKQVPGQIKSVGIATVRTEINAIAGALGINAYEILGEVDTDEWKVYADELPEVDPFEETPFDIAGWDY